jgi:hypothetical protein
MLRHVAILASALAGFLALARGVAWYGPYTYDQADYMYAVSLGWQANAFDSPSMRLDDFLKIGITRGRDAGSRADLSALIRGSNDVLFYRHWHGPLYGYWLSLTQRWTKDERATRKLNYLFAGATAVLLYFGTLWVLEGTAGQIAAILALMLYAWSYPVVKSSELAPHQLFGLLVGANLLLLAKIPGASFATARRCWYTAVAIAALAFCVLEVAFALILAVAACGWLARETLKLDWALAMRSAGTFLATVLVCWPGAVLKLSPVKSYLFMVYLAMFRKAAWGDDVGLAETWRLRLLNSPVPWLLLGAGLVYWFRRRKRDARLTPFAVFSGLMFVATFRVTTNVPRYELPLLPGIVLLGSFAAGLALAEWPPVRRNAAVPVLGAAMLISSWPAIRSQLSDPMQQTDTILALVRQHRSSVGQGTIWAPRDHLPMLHYYFPEVRFRGYDDESAIGGGAVGVITRGAPTYLQIQPRAQ